MSDKRWTDEDIDARAHDIIMALLPAFRNGDPVNAQELVAFALRQVRDDLAAQLQAAQQRIATLESQFTNWQHALGTSEQTADAQWVDAQTEVIARLKQRIAELEAI